MISILIADDQAVVRQGVKQIIAGEADMQIVGEAETGAQALELITANGLNVVILDIMMPGGRSGLDLLPEIKSLRPMIKVLILSLHTEKEFAVRALKSGASGYITKQSAPTELVRAIRKIHSGGRYISQSIAEQLAFSYSDDSNEPLHEKLSDREFQVLLMIAEGKTLREIADEFGITEQTVGTYRVRILEKLNMTRTAELTRYAVQNKLIE